MAVDGHGNYNNDNIWGIKFGKRLNSGRRRVIIVEKNDFTRRVPENKTVEVYLGTSYGHILVRLYLT